MPRAVCRPSAQKQQRQTQATVVGHVETDGLPACWTEGLKSFDFSRRRRRRRTSVKQTNQPTQVPVQVPNCVSFWPRVAAEPQKDIGFDGCFGRRVPSTVPSKISNPTIPPNPSASPSIPSSASGVVRRRNSDAEPSNGFHQTDARCSKSYDTSRWLSSDRLPSITPIHAIPATNFPRLLASFASFFPPDSFAPTLFLTTKACSKRKAPRAAPLRAAPLASRYLWPARYPS